jgi:16S rRNA processing protein RimM
VLVPFVKAIVPAVDLAAGTVTITPPEGLFEDLPDDDTEPFASDDDAGSSAADAGSSADDAGSSAS